MDRADRDLAYPASREQAEIPRRHGIGSGCVRQRSHPRKGCRRSAQRAAVNAGRSFRDVFGIEPAVTARAPGRVNLLGDHTDYNEGFVLPTVIPQETVVEAAVGGGMHQVYSATMDRLVQFGPGDLVDFARYVGGCVRALERRGIEVPPLKL